MQAIRGSLPRPALAVLASLALLLLLAVATRGATRSGNSAEAVAPPRVTFTPASGASYSGTTPTRNQAVAVRVCSDAIVSGSSTRSIVWNGASVVSSFVGASPEEQDALCETEVVFTGTVALENGTNTLVFSITDAQGTTTASATYTYAYAAGGVGTAAVAVTPDGGTQTAADSLPSAAVFTVTNTGSADATFALAAACSGAGVSGCGASRGSVTLASGESGAVGVSFRAGAAGSAATVKLKAWQADATARRDSGSVAVTVVNEPEAGHYGEAHTETVTARGLCLTAALGEGAAYECGDLRLVHALPATRILNRPSAPALLYNSRQARWMQIVGSPVTAPAVTPDSVKAVLTVAGVNRANAAWAGWTGGTTRWISLGFDANSLGTGIFPYTLTLTSRKAGVETALATRTGLFVQVNRSGSPYGRGWWVAGLEQVIPMAGNQVLWIGGDGSAKVYAPTGTAGRWVAASLTRPDTLKSDGAGGWVRELPGGGRVEFGTAGEHRFTRNALGHATEFVHAGGKLQKIVMARTGAFDTGYEYLFQYGTNGKLARVVAPYAAVPGDRDVVIATDAAGNVTSITDPDSSVVGFTPHATIAGPIVRRTDRMGVPTDFTYGGYLRLSRVEVDHDSTPGIATTFAPQEMQGRPGTPAVLLSDLATVIDGPRPAAETLDVTRFELDRFGAPRKVTDAAGDVTTVVRGDARFPALATYVRGPTGAERSAAYDARGRLVASTDWSRAAGVATSLYEWDPTWDAVVRTTSPTGIVSRSAYDPVTGQRLWTQRGTDPARRVFLTYHPMTDAAAPGLLASVRSAAAAARGDAATTLSYDARGNLAATVSPLGHVSRAYADRIGRDTLVTSQGAPSTRTVHDIRGRVRSSTTFTSAGGGSAVTLSRTYDRNGRELTNVRGVSPDSNGIGPMWIASVYDRVGRLVRRTHPDGRFETWEHDLAGQPVAHVSRRGLRTTFRYDAMGRLTRRITPEVRFAGMTLQQFGREWRFPRRRLDPDASAADSLAILADTATFTYGVGGVMLTADNRDARVSRTYNVDGSLATETQRVRTYQGAGFTSHDYTLAYAYDLEGRRRMLRHPSEFVAAGQDSVRYAFDAVGQLSGVWDPMGNAFAYTYDMEGGLQRVDQAGGVSETSFYDADGRRDSIAVRIANPYVGQADGFPTAVLADHGLVYDARGKITELTGSTVARAAYDGMGAMSYWMEASGAETNGSNTWTYADALGNPYRQIVRRVMEDANETRVNSETTYGYAPGTGRQTGMEVADNGTGNVQATESYGWDASGNRTQWSTSTVTGQWRTLQERTQAYYGADEKLRVVDRQRCMTNVMGSYTALGSAVCGPWDLSSGQDKSVFEEYRYDALGRRVLVRRRYAVVNGPDVTESCAGCWDVVERFVWDGQQILWEVRADGKTAPESDAATGVQHGQVGYTHAMGVDQPVSIIRRGYAAAPLVMVPHADYRGVLYGGHFASGRAVEGGVDVRSFPWAGGNTTVYMAERTPGTPTSWIGSLAENMSDASGQLYRRNRYYDPATGRFTQEDPIGIAGGLNLYGYGNGDPVSYTDPFGLCPYYGNRRSRNLSDCPKSMQWLTDAFSVMTLSAIGNRTIDEVISSNLTIAEGSCGGQMAACYQISTETVTVGQGHSTLFLAGQLVHEVTHHVAQRFPATRVDPHLGPAAAAARAEMAAWAVEFEFYREFELMALRDPAIQKQYREYTTPGNGPNFLRTYCQSYETFGFACP